jgi:hypothetical protein
VKPPDKRDLPDKGFVVYRLEYKDGTIDIGLEYVHRAYLCFLADRGGEDRFDYSKLTPEQRVIIKKLVDPFRCIQEHASIGDRADLVIHRLTDTGRNIVDAIRKAGGP